MMRIGLYPRVQVDTNGTGMVAQSGGVALVETERAAGTGEPLTCRLRKGNVGSNAAADHITVVRAALAQLPGHTPGTRPGRKVLIRADGAGCTHDLLNWLVGQRLLYSVGFSLPDTFAATPEQDAEARLGPAYDGDGQIRDGAWVADVTATGTASPPSPPTPPAASSPISNCATGAEPAARTASASRKTPG